MLIRCIVVLYTALATALPPSPQQQQQQQQQQHVLDISDVGSKEGKQRKLHGKFLHITDIHPDPYYRRGTDPGGEHPCHGGEGSAGLYGAESTECDSPFSLVNATFDWIKHNIKDEIDFVIWTGDSARHDNDEKIPRSNKGVEQLNKFVVSKFVEVFGKPDNRHDPDPTNDFIVPIVPTFGNNDILPHNIFEPGPNRWTRKYLTIWEKFVPQEQRHSFARGGWFFTEVIPNRLAVFSLNTLYFFDSNGAVDGCENPNEPGYEHFEWLRIQLEFLRQRKMKAILMGHVPPARTESKQNWDETCYQKYTLWLRQYRDVIVGSIFGHMNLDHFMLQDVKELTYRFDIDRIDTEDLQTSSSSISDGYKTEAKADYLSDLRQLWANLPTPPKGLSYQDLEVEPLILNKHKKKRRRLERFLKNIGGPFGERFSLSLVSPSVVPNFYPTLRVVEYNITGLEHVHSAPPRAMPGLHDLTEYIEPEVHQNSTEWWNDTGEKDNELHLDYDLEVERRKKKHKRKKGKKNKPKFPVPHPPSKATPPGPAYSPQTLSLVSWRQFYANLTEINAAVARESDAKDRLAPTDMEDFVQTEMQRKHFAFELEYDTREDKVYKMADLTMRSWLSLAERIGRTRYTATEDELEQTLSAKENRDVEPTSAYRNKPSAIDSTALPDIEAIHTDQNPQEAVLSLRKFTDPSAVVLEGDFDKDEHEADEDGVHGEKKKRKHGRKRKDKALKKNHLWHAFVKRAFVGTKGDQELEDEFG